ncbi:MAG: hypothetical protein ACREJO_04810 [Phycisphaerales bacterium]
MADAAAWKPARGWVIARRAGFLGAVAVMLVWGVTLWGGITLVVTTQFRVALYGGSMNMTRGPGTYGPGVYTYKTPAGAMWFLPGYQSSGTMAGTTPATRTDVIMPLWIVALGLAVVAWVGERHCKRYGPGMCGRCGYDLRGIPKGKGCPECGEGKGK